MFLKQILLIVFTVGICTAKAQTAADTSYTVHGTYKKEVKKYPFIKIANRNAHASVTNIRDIVYHETPVRQLHIDASYNKQDKNHPAVILIHGGGWKSGNKDQMHLLAQEIAAKGYACFCVEYRLSGEAAYPAGIQDVKAAIKYIKTNAEKFNADQKRVAVLGCSSGGQMAALIGATNGKPEFEDKDIAGDTNVNAIIDMDGILAFHHPESEEGQVAAQWLGGTYQDKPEIWQQASALTHAGKNTPPILFINSDKPRFHAGRDDMIAILNRFGIYSEVKSIEGSPHSFWFFDPWFDQVVAWSVQFLEKTLKSK